ncbi:MAG: translation initiation factor IF-2 [Candidatus Melainabacteria bacterium]|nr:translation initiation factor IF-2 [Candidatus Melainabacteria bacterium]
MDDRVRIYELARKMNISNQDIITTLRELGYDIKSHSSTIDKHAVGQLIAAIDKKKKGGDDKKTAKAGKPQDKPAAGAAKASKILPPPEPAPVVKPRVLSRYRPDRPAETPVEPPAEPETIEPAASTEAQPSQAPQANAAGEPAQSAQSVQASQASQAQAPSGIAAGQAQPASEGEQPVAGESQAAPSKPIEPQAKPGVTGVAPSQKNIQGQTQGQPGAQAIQGQQNRGGEVLNRQAAPLRPEVRQSNQPLSREEEKRKESTTETPFEEMEPIIRATGDEWSDGSKYAPRVIRKLDQPPKTKKVEEEVKPAAKEQEVPKSKDKDRARDKKEEDKADSRHSKKRVDFVEEDVEDELAELKGQAVRPMTPSVPIRIAAPSMRATPPRPPKSHRPGAADRHGQKKEEKVRPAAAVVEVPKSIVLNTSVTVQELANKMAVAETEIIKRLFMKGVMRTVNQMVELELARELAVEMEYEVLSEEVQEAKEEKLVELSEEDKANLVTRPPVVTIMGHVDHGKTSLLDAIRQTKFNLTDAEHGGITQHIGAYHVEVPDEEGHMRQIVFLDTPGHEAFTAMRARGAKVTDIAILVVAADDGVMPQTVEALDHAKAAGVPIIVAVNKVDKAGADPERVLTQLMNHNLVSEKYGGDTVTVEVSAKKRTGLDNLLEMILLVSDILELKANPEKPAEGVIVEAELSRGKGAVATALVENGTLREGDFIVAGSKCGRVRALFDDRGQRVKAAGPSMPVEVLGLDEVPLAGDRFEVVDDAQGAKMLAELRKQSEAKGPQHHVTLESLHDLLESGEVKELNIIVKADVQGTAEAIADSIRKLSSSEVQTRVLRTASGDISENDVNLAASSNAIIVGFNVQPDQNGARVAEANGVDVRTYNIIYQITDDIMSAIQGLLKPIREEVQIGQAEVRQIFKVGKGLMIAGCMVLSGKVQRGSIARIERNGQVIHEGKLDTLKRFKDDAKEVAQGFECGMSFDKFSDLQIGDKINSFIVQETKRELS